MIIMRPDEANTSTKRKKALIDTFNLRSCTIRQGIFVTNIVLKRTWIALSKIEPSLHLYEREEEMYYKYTGEINNTTGALLDD